MIGIIGDGRLDGRRNAQGAPGRSTQCILRDSVELVRNVLGEKCTGCSNMKAARSTREATMIEKDVGIAHAAGSESSLIFNEVVSSECEIDSIIGRPNSRVRE